MLGWKEYEMEVVRDRADNCIIICSIENIDPMGVHTGDSVTVAPALTLTDKEYQIMRNASIAVLREIGVDTGGSNVQFAVNPADGAAGHHRDEPARLALLGAGLEGDRLPDRQDRGEARGRLHARRAHATRSRGVTPASFEPTIDYVVTKMPRFTFEKFPGAEPLLTTSMKSVGEAMAIGRSFAESVQKALRSMETGLTGFNEIEIPGARAGDKDAIRARPRQADARPPADHRAGAIAHGLTIEEIHAACKYDPWFLEEIARSSLPRARCATRRLAERAPGSCSSKRMGFSDARLAELSGTSEADVSRPRARARRPSGLQAHRYLRRRVPLAHALYVFDLRGRRR